MLLKIINGKRQGEVVSLGSSDPITIGRGGDNHLDLPDSKISRQHAQVFSNQGKWFLKNVQPTKPVYVNEIP
ncbi:MAG: FHA domain-containing protein, partial [Ardenticatenaceae bacterium]